MTENMSLLVLHQSPTKTAQRMLMVCGAPRALQLVKGWIRGIAEQPEPPLMKLAFWTDVAVRLSEVRRCEP